VSDLLVVKARLREQIRSRLRASSNAERARASEAIRWRLQEQAVWHRARAVLYFASRPAEPDLWLSIASALEGGKRVCLPRSVLDQDAFCAAEVRDLRNDIVPGRFGIREPGLHCPEIPLNRLDLILVPGLGFDRSGHRLGRGKGYYDRWLAARSGLTCGVAFDEQLLDAVPVGPHDVSLDCIVTPSQWIEVSPHRAVQD
jgi:5-formyltetrahydrofolate cyclo-ligase